MRCALWPVTAVLCWPQDLPEHLPSLKCPRIFETKKAYHSSCKRRTTGSALESGVFLCVVLQLNCFDESGTSCVEKNTACVRCADGPIGRCVGFLLASVAADKVSVRSVGDSLNSAYDRVVGRDLMCCCVQSFLIVRIAYTW